MNQYEQMKKYYADIIDEDFNDHYLRPDHILEISSIVSLIPTMFPQGSILELASGGCYWTRKLAREYYRVYGLDQTITELAKMSEYVRNISYKQIDLLNIEAFQKATCDIHVSGVFTCCWISHILKIDLLRYLTDLACDLSYILQPGGSIVFVDCLRWDDSNIIEGTDGNTYHKRTFKDGSELEVVRNYYRIDDWVRLIEQNSLGRIVEYKEFGKYYFMVKWQLQG